MAETIAGMTQVIVRCILPPVDTRAPKRRPNDRRAEAEHWPDEDRSKRKRAIPIQYFGAMNDQGRCGWRMRHRRNRRHSRDRPGTTPSHQRHKRGLDLIIGGMAGHDCCRARRQCQVCEELVSPLTS